LFDAQVRVVKVVLPLATLSITKKTNNKNTNTMRTTIHTSVRASALTIAAGLFLSAGSLAYADSPFPYLVQSLTRVITMAMAIDKGDVDLVPGNSLLGAYLQPGQPITYRVRLQAGVHYIVLSAADEDVIDLDLNAKDASGRILSQDTLRDAAPVIEFVATQDGDVTFEMRNVQSRRASFCAMLILQKNYSGGLATRHLAQALDNAIDLTRSAGLYFTKFAEGSFCLFGGRLDSGASTYMYNMRPEPGRYIVISAGSDNIADVDNHILEQNRTNDPDGVWIAQDNTIGRAALSQFDVQEGKNYRIEHKNYGSQFGSSGFVFSCLLRQ
jgi:hypothetical protein